MKINIYHESKIYSTKIKTPVSVRDIILNIKASQKLPNQNFYLLNSNKNIIPETELISPKEEEKIYYLVPQLNKYISEIKDEKKEESIEDYIMKVTGAKTKLEKKKIENEDRYQILNQLPIGGNLGRLLEMIQFLEERNSIQIRTHQFNNDNIEANENLVNQLKDMGFPEDRARAALIRSRNELSVATDILLGEGGQI